MRAWMVAFIVSAGVSSALAHLGAGTFSTDPEAPYKAKATVTLKWTVTVPHDGTDIEYSPNGGKTWVMVRKDYAKGANGAQTFTWTVPDTATETGMLRICQKAGATGCTNADTVSRPSAAPYTLVSRRFKVEAAPVALIGAASQASGFLQRTGEGVVEMKVKVDAPADLVVAAYDVNGSETQALFARRLNAGVHNLSLFSEALRAHPQWILRARLNGRDLSLNPAP